MIHVMLSGATRNPIGSVARLDMIIACGFGMAVVTRDGEIVLNGERPGKVEKRLAGKDFLRVRDVERYVRRHAKGMWMIEIDAPLWNAKWKRVRPGKWICVETGMGFA